MTRHRAMKCADATQGRGAKGVAVVGVLKRNKACAVGLALKLAKLDGHSHCRLDRRRSVVTKEDTGEGMLREK